MTNHIQFAELGGDWVYCHWRGQIVRFTPNQTEHFCFAGCPFFAGTAQGDGIECNYADGTDEPLMSVPCYIDEAVRDLAQKSRPFFKPDPKLPVDPGEED